MNHAMCLVVAVLWIASRARRKLPHELQVVVGRPTGLRKAQASLDALQILSSRLIAHNVSGFVTFVQLFSSRPFVNANHGHADGPGAAMLALHRFQGLATHALPMLNRK